MSAFTDTLQKNIQEIFPESMVHIKVTKFLSRPYIDLFFTLGKDKTEWAHGIYENDPLIQRISIEGVTEDGEPTANMRVESGSGDMVIKSVSPHKVYDRVKFGWRNFAATSETQVVKRITEYFKKVKKIMLENVDKMADDHKKMVMDKYGKAKESINQRRHIMLFEEYTSNTELKEGLSKVERIQGYFEGDFMELPLIKKITDSKKLGWQEDYELDSDEDSVWIELKGISKKFIDEIDADYDAFAKEFEEWAEKHKLGGAQILTSDPDKNGDYSFTFSVDHKSMA